MTHPRDLEPGLRAATPADLAALAEQAREFADQHPPGSLGRRAWGCAAVALATTRSLAAARKALDAVRLDDVRAAALRALDTLTEDTP